MDSNKLKHKRHLLFINYTSHCSTAFCIATADIKSLKILR
jgi:hypothetical protein